MSLVSFDLWTELFEALDRLLFNFLDGLVNLSPCSKSTGNQMSTQVLISVSSQSPWAPSGMRDAREALTSLRANKAWSFGGTGDACREGLLRRRAAAIARRRRYFATLGFAGRKVDHEARQLTNQAYSHAPHLLWLECEMVVRSLAFEPWTTNARCRFQNAAEESKQKGDNEPFISVDIH